MTQKIDPKLIKIDAGTEGQALVISNGELSFGSVAAGGGGSSSISVSETAPTEPSEGDLWFDSSTSNIYVYYDGYWIEPAFKVTVAASDDYNDLTNTPALSAVATSGNYTDLSNTPTLATVATSGDYNDLSNLPSFATETYVDTAVSNLVDSAPATLDTLNELATALGDDPNFATTVTNSLSTKASTGKAIAMAIVFGG